MDEAKILELVKSRLGISMTVRDPYLSSIIKSVISELEGEKKIALDPESMNHVMFVADYAVWRYQSRDQGGGTPEHIMWRLRNLFLSNGGDSDVQP